MTSTLLVNELTNLASEAKRKNVELRNAAEKSLQELKSLPATSEQQIAADLSRRPNFIEPFLIACGTRSAKFAGSGVTCLQRLVISRGLPKARLKDALEAFNACTGLSLDVQLKILQALPSLLQNYSDDLKDDLLSSALEVCSSLQSVKVQTVSGVAAATLQQLVATIFERVASEDRHSDERATNQVPGSEGPIALRSAAFDAYRVFRDLALAADDRKTNFVHLSSLSQESSLELIGTCINANPQLFSSHDELKGTIQSNVLPSITRALAERQSFAITVRSMRILDIVLGRYVADLPAECEAALGMVIYAVDIDSSPLWKRALVMEVLRNFFSDGAHVIDAYSIYDATRGGKSIVQDLLSAFVRLSAEKPSLIGLGQQSTVPIGPSARRDSSDQAVVDATSGVAGIISSALGVAEVNVAGISSRWSIPRSPCMEQLDKAEPPVVPETYIYALVLECLNSMSDGLARVVLPLTVNHEKALKTAHDEKQEAKGHTSNGRPASSRIRSQSFRKRTVPLNPLLQEDHTSSGRLQAVNGLVESCWPAVLATSSTFLNAALDDQYYRNLIKAYQRFTQVAGLLRLSTARDALMTTLGKAAVPPHVLNAAIAEPPRTPATESPRVFSNPKSLLSVDSLVSQASTLSVDRDRRASAEPSTPMLTTRNLLCLRALLNLAIALGPTLETAFSVVVDTLRQADTVLSATTPQQIVKQGLTASQRGSESPNIVQAFTNEVTAVESAASRLLESTADYPNDAFSNVLTTFCRLLHGKDPAASTSASPRPGQMSPPPTPTLKSRTFSGLTGISSLAEMQLRDYKFVIPKLGSLAELNISRFASNDPVESGWTTLVDELVLLASNSTGPKEARRAATSVLCKVASEIIAEVMEDEADTRSAIQRRALAVLLRLIDSIYAEDGELTGSDVELQGQVVDALRSILERSGESLAAGWNRTIAIISSVFERSGIPPERHDAEETHIDWEHISKDLVSVHLGRTAFAACELICSDFLAPLSAPVLPALIELLYRFACQTDDLNVSLTTITMTWNVSDFLLGRTPSHELDEVAIRVKEADDFEEEVQGAVRSSTSAQWLLLLLRLQAIIKSCHKEVRKAAFQTVCSIFKNNGEQLTHGTWDLTLRSIILRIAFYDVYLYRAEPEEYTQLDDEKPQDEDVSIAIISGTSDVVAQHLRSIEQVKQLPSLWEAFLSRLEAYLDLERPKLNTAVYQALTMVLSQIPTKSRAWSGPMYRTLHLWLKRNPASIEAEEGDSNQLSLLAYVDAGVELYRLTSQSMSMSQTRTLVEGLYLVVRHADGPRYGADAAVLSPLQSKAFKLLQKVQTDTPSTLVTVAAKMVRLHHDTARDNSSHSGPTFIAIASQAIDWLQALVLKHLTDADVLETGVLVAAIHSLRRLTETKYNFTVVHKEQALWQKATAAALRLAKPVLEQCDLPHFDKSSKSSIWTEFAYVTGGIVRANGLELIGDPVKIYEHELEDIKSFETLRDVLIPRLGAPDLPEDVRFTYARALFEASIIHPTEFGELPEAGASSLQGIGRMRRGRTRRVPYSKREQMCYACLSELIRLSSTSDDTVERKKLAQAAAPLLILRLAIPIRAYIADQPLRGSRPQPLSELEELLFCFDAIKNLDLAPEALTADPITAGRTGRKAHLHYLYPLLVKAVGTAGDRWSGADEVLTPLQAVLEAVALVE